MPELRTTIFRALTTVSRTSALFARLRDGTYATPTALLLASKRTRLARALQRRNKLFWVSMTLWT